MQGAADWAATIIAAIIIFTIFCFVIDWIADRAINAVRWLTRRE